MADDLSKSTPLRRLAVISKTVSPDGLQLRSVRALPVAAPAEEFEPKRVLFTGGAGFIGSNVLIHMVQTYPSVFFVCFDNLSEGSNQANFEPVEKAANLVFVKGNIADEVAVRKVMTDHGVD